MADTTPEPSPGKPTQSQKNGITYATITSTIALIISCLSFYFTNIQEVHSLQCGVVRDYTESFNDDSLIYHSDLILLNKGNRTETLLSIEITYSSPEDSSIIASFTSVRSASRGPYVLKSGDAMPVHLNDWIISLLTSRIRANGG